MIRSVGAPPEPESQLTIETVTDPAAIARCQLQHERAKRNSDWLQAHWADVLPQARGKFLAVAGQQAHIADTARQAWDWAAATHPDDNGVLVRYIPQETGPRIYAHRR